MHEYYYYQYRDLHESVTYASLLFGHLLVSSEMRVVADGYELPCECREVKLVPLEE